MQTPKNVPKSYLIGLACALPIAAFFVAKVPLKSEFSPVSGLFIILFAVPSYFAVYKALGKKRGLLAVGALSLFALIVETSAIHTGFPYGNFVYNNILGNKILGFTPWTVAFAYPPILLVAWYLASLCAKKIPWLFVAILTGCTAMVFDLVLDPGAVKLGFWYWLEPGHYYGVPIINFLGWVLTSSVGGIILHYLWGQKIKHTPRLAYSGLIIIWFWTWINMWLAQWIPAILGLAISLVLMLHFRNKQIQ